MAITIREFLTNFADNYSALHLDDIKKGTICHRITNEIYLVQKGEVKQ